MRPDTPSRRCPRLPSRRGRAATAAALLLLLLAAGACGQDDGGAIDGGGGTAPLRPGATYPPTTTSAP